MSDYKNIPVSPELKERLEGLKPYPSLSWEDLLTDMADHYEAADRHRPVAADGAG